MRACIIALALSVATAASASAQSERAYVSAAGGFAVSPDTTSGNVLLEGGVRVRPHLLAFADVGQFHNLQPSDTQPIVDQTITDLSADGTLNVLGTARTPAWYSIGGLRLEVPGTRRVSPYVLGGLGAARLNPVARFMFASGTLPGSTPAVGDDVTGQLTSLGDFTQPPASTAFMFTFGGGVQVPLVRRWTIDAGYRFSRVQAESPLNAQGATFGFGYRF